ncbi:hypothetical protein CNYM01_11608 [Colletotrichum nymphaeae SA-01]|uniref:Clr5 domain-containing protein n=1 Tax=Colletotrichum nymphaeae SA-01 TaxID=1460502 RepID=A0A135TIS6_9PEZI|nr:hypothetical protein CNYM01_11608 [Colletotrichum nymphaeae SA-01]
MDPFPGLEHNANAWSSTPQNQNVSEPQFHQLWYHHQPQQIRLELPPAMWQPQNGVSLNNSTVENRSPQGKRRKHNSLNWDLHQSELKQLYLNEDKTLAETMKVMKERHNFDASTKLYKLQFKKWEWHKNLPATHSRFMVEKARKRKHEENKDTVFTYGNQTWDRNKYATLSRNYSTPADVHYRTPKQIDFTSVEESHHGDESAAGLSYDVSDEDSDVPMYLRGDYDASSDLEFSSDDEEGQSDDSDGVGIPLLRSNGLTRDGLLSLLSSARRHIQEGRMIEAEQSYLQASQAFSDVMGRTNHETLSVKYELANFYAQHQRTADADDIIDTITSEHIKEWGYRHDRTQKHILHTVELLETWGRSADALGILSHSNEIIDKLNHRRRRCKRGSRTHNEATQSQRLGPVHDLQQITQEITEECSLATLEHGISVAKTNVIAKNRASEGLLLAILQHCIKHPQGLYLRRVQAMAELLSLYTKLGETDVHEPYFVSAEDTLKGVWNDYDWDKERFQSIELLEASMQLALNILRGGFKGIAQRIFLRVDDKAKSLFGHDDERTIWILITIGLAYQSNSTWDHAREWFEGAFAAALASDRWDEEDGIVRSLQNAMDKRHFSYLSDEGRPYKTIFGVSGISVRPGRLHLS